MRAALITDREQVELREFLCGREWAGTVIATLALAPGLDALLAGDEAKTLIDPQGEPTA